MKLSNDVEKYEIEVTEMGKNYSFFFCSGKFLRLPTLHVVNNCGVSGAISARQYIYQVLWELLCILCA